MAGFELATKVKICLLGETVGKSSLIKAFINNTFSGKQIEHDHMEEVHHKQLEMMNEVFNLEITDTTQNNEIDETFDDILKIEWKGMDGYSLDIREHWIMNNDILFLCFNRINRISWMMVKALYEVTTQYLSKQNNILNTQKKLPIFVLSTCSDIYLSQTSLSNLDSIDLVSFKEVEKYISRFDNMFHYETSSKVDYNIDTVFKAAVTKYNELYPRKKKKRKKKKTNVYNAEPIDIPSQKEIKSEGITILEEEKTINNGMNDTQCLEKEKKTEQISVAKKKEESQQQQQQENEEEEEEEQEQDEEQEQEQKKEEEEEEKALIKEAKREENTDEDKDDEYKLMEYEELREENGYNTNRNILHCESPPISSPLSSVLSLSSQEIYNIEYSSKYKESMDFKNLQKMFNKYHQINFFYEQQSQNGQNDEFGQYEYNMDEYKTSSLLFFKDLDATLTTIGCRDNDKKIFFIQCRQHIVFKMIDSINLSKHQYEYLDKIRLLTGPLILKLDDVFGDDYWSILSDACFVCKLKMDYNEWMIDDNKSENEFKNELSGALHINPIYISINGVGRGLNDIIIDWTVMYIWIPYYIQGAQCNLIYREYRIRPQDQIEVQYKKKWIPCTILQVKDTLNAKGKQIKVRYNKLNGYDRFKTSNTEWIWTIKQCERLRIPDKVYVIVSYNGVKIGTSFKPPLLANCRNGNKQLLDIGHHIFIQTNNIWYRCEIINAAMNGKKIQILYLVNTFVKNTQWLRLWEPADLKRISLQDMRM